MIGNTIHYKEVWVFFISAMICLPCSVKAEFTDNSQMKSELMHCFFLGGKNLSQRGMQIMPLHFFEQLGVNGGSKGNRGGGEIVSSISLYGECMVETLSKPLYEKSTRNGSYHANCPSFSLCTFEKPFEHDPWKTPLWWLFLAFVIFSQFPFRAFSNPGP